MYSGSGKLPLWVHWWDTGRLFRHINIGAFKNAQAVLAQALVQRGGSVLCHTNPRQPKESPVILQLLGQHNSYCLTHIEVPEFTHLNVLLDSALIAELVHLLLCRWRGKTEKPILNEISSNNFPFFKELMQIWEQAAQGVLWVAASERQPNTCSDKTTLMCVG